ncbi:MAG TPA: hypothetical protein VG735_11970 [Caulobacterales bacterium]|jgi:hypothetical protein|nr:hypothetical protein [Caulobacterales bacterium]
MYLKSIVAVAALALCASCGPKPAASAAPSISAAPCPDDGPRLPETGVCQGRAWAYLDDFKGAREPSLPGGCTWSVNETMLPGDEALLYRAASCKGVTTKLAYAGGAHSASISYETSAVFGNSVKGQEVIRLFGTDPDPQGALKEQLAALPKAEREKCEIHPAGIDTWPSDALVIGPTKAARAKMPKDEPISACGPLGLDEDSQTFWRIKQGFAWFFQLGQEETDFDPATITVIAKNAEGGWGAKE